MGTITLLIISMETVLFKGTQKYKNSRKRRTKPKV